MPARATGRAGTRDGRAAVLFDRTFTAAPEQVWAAVTESDRLARWIGPWSGDPASGSVTLQMSAEGDDLPGTRYEIDRCEPPRGLTVRAVDEAGGWNLAVDLHHEDGVTTLTFSQLIDDAAALESIGPGWDWYLDRLVAAESGHDVSALDFERDYYPALGEHYRRVAAELTSP
jgi:uncharacterized protein YndB with AHSA1/START domain